MNLTYDQLLQFGSAMAIYFLFTFPLYVIYLIDCITELVKKIKKRKL